MKIKKIFSEFFSTDINDFEFFMEFLLFINKLFIKVILLFLVSKNPVRQFVKLIESIIAEQDFIISKFEEKDEIFSIEMLINFILEKLKSIREFSRVMLIKKESRILK